MKASGKQIAQRYVKALFDVTTNAADRAAVEKDLAALAEALEASKPLRAVLANPLLTRKDQENAMSGVLTYLKAHKITAQFIAMLVRQKRLVLLPDVIVLFADVAAAARGELKAELISALPLGDKDIDAIRQKLAKAYGKTITVQTRQDKDLLGGVVIKIGSLQLDSSLSGKMRRLKLALKAA